MKKYKAFIVDDEIQHIKILRIYLKKYFPEINVIGSAMTVKDGLDKILETDPDFLFLDINMGNDDTFSLLDSLEEFEGQIIFVSAYGKKYAIKAFKYRPVDYLLKPINVKELVAAVNKAIYKLNNYKYFKNSSASLEKELPKLRFVAINTGVKIELVKVESVVYCEAQGRNTIFYFVDGTTKRARRNLGEFEKALDLGTFFRIHNKYLVNMGFVVNISKNSGKNYCHFGLSDFKVLPIANRKRELLQKFLKIK